ncbi:MAG: hypothetical protein U0X71_02650 [Sphingobacteriaceae bacterium]
MLTFRSARYSGSTQALVYNINGIASGYTVSGSLTVIGSSYPKDKLASAQPM